MRKATMKTKIHTLAVLAGLAAGLAAVSSTTEASAQEIQISGPLAGASAVRRIRLHREGRFDVAPTATFTLLDEFRRNILFGARLNYHFTDWFGAGLWAAGGISYNTGLGDELQSKAVDGRNCSENPNTLACKRTAVNLCRGPNCLGDKQLGSIVWMIAPQATFVPFRGKFSVFGKAFMDADISLFAGPAIVGLRERVDCVKGTCAPSTRTPTRSAPPAASRRRQRSVSASTSTPRTTFRSVRSSGRPRSRGTRRASTWRVRTEAERTTPSIRTTVASTSTRWSRSSRASSFRPTSKSPTDRATFVRSNSWRPESFSGCHAGVRG